VLITRLPRAFWTYIVFTLALLIYAVLDGTHLMIGGLLLIAFLSLRLAKRGHWAWAILVMVNALPTLGTLAMLFARSDSIGYSNGRVIQHSSRWAITPDTVLLAVIFVGIEASLLSRSMRRYVDSGGGGLRTGRSSPQPLPFV
jgi:hypothetical protein